MDMSPFLIRLGRSILLPGLFLVLFILQGCTTPNVTVTCGCSDCGSSGGGGGTGPSGACSPVSYSMSAVGFKSVSGPPGETHVPAGSNETCRGGSTKCGSPAGTCNRKTCINYFNYNNDDCWCGCQ